MKGMIALFFLVALLSDPLDLRGQTGTSFGPITLGRVLPALPACQEQQRFQSSYEGQGVCQKTDTIGVRTVWNVPYDGAKTDIGQTDACYRKSNQSLPDTDANCPVAQVTVSIAEEQCAPVLTALKTKFGAPRVGTEVLANGFGARWQHTTYAWVMKDGAIINYSVHLERDGGCFLLAETSEYKAEYDARVHKKVQF
jgi:hypothetical protein